MPPADRDRAPARKTGAPALGRRLHPLAQLAVIVHAQVAATAEANGTTPMQARMLGLLSQGPRRMADLADALCVERAALTGLVDRAEARGLVQRAAVPGDRRSTHVTLTDAGRTASTAFYTQLDDALENLIAQLPPNEQDPYRAGTQAIVAAAARPPTIRLETPARRPAP